MEKTRSKKHSKVVESESEDSETLSIEDGASSEEEEVKSLQKLYPKLPKSFEEKDIMPRVFVILEAANLETIKTKRGIELLNSDDH